MPPRGVAGGSAARSRGRAASAGPSLDTSQFEEEGAAAAAAQASGAGGSHGSHGTASGGADGGTAGPAGGAATAPGATVVPPPPPSPPPPLYHVAAVDQGFHLEPETLSYWGYDDGTSTLLVAKGGLVFAYDMSYGQGAVAYGSADQLRWTFPLPEGPSVAGMRLSLDGGLLAIQRSPVMLEFVDLASGNVFVQGTDRGRGEILSFFFTELAGSEVVLVTPTGLELLEWVPRRQGLRLREKVRMPVEWAIYSHETRMVLLGTHAAGTSFIKAFQFVSSGLVALPPFTAGAAASALVLMAPAGGGGAGAGALVAASPLAAAAVATPPARVTPDCLRLIKVYGRVYCAHINRRALRLELYRFYTDTVVLQHTYELFSPAVELAVVDSVIVAHCTTPAETQQHDVSQLGTQSTAGTDAAAVEVAAAAGAAAPSLAQAGVAMLFDVAAPTAQPIANPLPARILWHGPPLPPAAAAGSAPAETPPAPQPAAAGAASDEVRRWEYIAPNVVLDRGGQTAFRLALNLPAVAESCSDPAIAVGFLQRRRGPTAPPTPAVAAAPAAGAAAGQEEGGDAAKTSAKALLLSVVRNALQERMPLPTVRAMFEDLCAGYAAALDRELAVLAATAAAGGTAGPLPPPAGAVPMPQYITADELASELFRWLHDEEVVDAPYLQAALYEYMAAATAAGIPLPPYLQELSVEVLLQQSQYNQVLQLMYGQGDQLAPGMVQKLLSPPTTADGSSATTAPEAASGAAEGGGSPPSAPAEDEGPLSRQVALDSLARAALADRYEPVAGGAGAGGQPPRILSYGGGPAGAAAGGVGNGSDASSYVSALLAAGAVLRAARVLRRYRVGRPSVKEFIAAVGARGNEAELAAVYRVFQDELLASYPKYDLAARKLLPPPPAVAVPAQ